jgi:hypothetical protein
MVNTIFCLKLINKLFCKIIIANLSPPRPRRRPATAADPNNPVGADLGSSSSFSSLDKSMMRTKFFVAKSFDDG